jgi:PAP2 superfamily
LTRGWRLLLLVLVGAALALGTAVSMGATKAIDSYSVANLTPWRACPYHPQSSIDQLIAPLPAAFCHSAPPRYSPPRAGRVAFGLAATAAPLPAIIALVALVCLLGSVKRGRTVAVGLCALGGATIAEVIGKLVVTRPAPTRTIHGHSVLLNIAHSFPCGHTIRACVITYVVTAMRPAWSVAVFVWFFAVNVALVATSGHTLTDIAGGVVIGGAICVLMEHSLGGHLRHYRHAVRGTAH